MPTTTKNEREREREHPLMRHWRSQWIHCKRENNIRQKLGTKIVSNFHWFNPDRAP